MKDSFFGTFPMTVSVHWYPSPISTGST